MEHQWKKELIFLKINKITREGTNSHDQEWNRLSLHASNDNKGIIQTTLHTFFNNLD